MQNISAKRVVTIATAMIISCVFESYMRADDLTYELSENIPCIAGCFGQRFCKWNDHCKPTRLFLRALLPHGGYGVWKS
jgi:hypothetical protein